MSTQDRAEARVAPPAPRWKNWWRYERRVVHNNGMARGPGVISGLQLWPSRDVAETMAHELVAVEPYGRDGISYLGAFPESERPGGAGQ